MESVRQQLAAAGLTIIPTPGAFFGYADDECDASYNINFLNAVTGFSPKTQHYYYITAGAPGRLGKILMDVFAEFIHSQSENTVVYYTGRKGSDPSNFDQAHNCLNICHCGPHCLTNEIKTEAHTIPNTA